MESEGRPLLHHRFHQYEYFKGSIPERQTGSWVSMASGPVSAYALDGLQDRARAFVEPGDHAYPGQIVGEHSRDSDLVVNAQRAKKLTNMRAAGADKAIKLPPAIKFTLEEALEYLNHDECVEVTPRSIRLRKLILDENARRQAQKQAMAMEESA